jgi:tetratricopeptide (TPR) repeat protein
MDPVDFPGWPARALLPFQALGEYVVMLATPWRSQLVIGSVGWVEPLRVVLGALAALGLGWLCLRAVRGRMSWQQGELLALGLAALAPVLHLVPLPTRMVAADRFLYLPLAGIGVALALLVPALPPGRNRALIGLGLVATLLAYGTHLRERDWQDEVRLWTVEAARAHPANGVAHFEYANVLGRTGDMDGALAGYEESLRRERVLKARVPEYQLPAGLLANTALILSARGDESGIPLLEELIVIAPESQIHHIYLASALARAFRFEEADARFEAAERLFPDDTLTPQLRQQARQAASVWASLPPQELQEPIPIRAQRAFAYHLVGRLEESADLWIQVVRSGEATPQDLRIAREALQQQRNALGDTPQLQALAEALDTQ